MYDIKNERFLVSRDVVFIDTEFPFATMKSSANETTSNTPSDTPLLLEDDAMATVPSCSG